jgi:hypothetical protein
VSEEMQHIHIALSRFVMNCNKILSYAYLELSNTPGEMVCKVPSPTSRSLWGSLWQPCLLSGARSYDKSRPVKSFPEVLNFEYIKEKLKDNLRKCCDSAGILIIEIFLFLFDPFPISN